MTPEESADRKWMVAFLVIVVIMLGLATYGCFFADHPITVS